MTGDAKRNWQIRLAALAIFVLGFAGGALALSLYDSSRRAAADDPEARKARFEQTLDRLNLNDGQRTDVKKIFGEARREMGQVRRECGPKFREVRERTDAKLQAVMTPEQWEKFRAEMRARHGEHDRHSGGPDRGGPGGRPEGPDDDGPGGGPPPAP